MFYVDDTINIFHIRYTLNISYMKYIFPVVHITRQLNNTTIVSYIFVALYCFIQVSLLKGIEHFDLPAL